MLSREESSLITRVNGAMEQIARIMNAVNGFEIVRSHESYVFETRTEDGERKRFEEAEKTQLSLPLIGEFDLKHMDLRSQMAADLRLTVRMYRGTGRPRLMAYSTNSSSTVRPRQTHCRGDVATARSVQEHEAGRVTALGTSKR